MATRELIRGKVHNTSVNLNEDVYEYVRFRKLKGLKFNVSEYINSLMLEDISKDLEWEKEREAFLKYTKAEWN